MALPACAGPLDVGAALGGCYLLGCKGLSPRTLPVNRPPWGGLLGLCVGWDCPANMNTYNALDSDCKGFVERKVTRLWSLFYMAFPRPNLARRPRSRARPLPFGSPYSGRAVQGNKGAHLWHASAHKRPQAPAKHTPPRPPARARARWACRSGKLSQVVWTPC